MKVVRVIDIELKPISNILGEVPIEGELLTSFYTEYSKIGLYSCRKALW